MMRICVAFLRLPRVLRWSSLFLLPAAAWAAVWYILPHFAGDAVAELQHQTPVRTVYAERGERIAIQRTFDWQWRKPVPLESLPPFLVPILLAVEDAHFFDHGGADMAAILRALYQNLTSRARLSGASTISMQLAGLPEAGKRKSLPDKFRQIIRARALEMRYDKKTILSEYLNRVPFGGKIYGMEAAAQYYFGIPVSQLRFAEAALLCGLPQRPNAFRPDRHPEKARERLRIVLHLLIRRRVLAPQEAEKLRNMRFRDFRRPFAWRELEKFSIFSFAAQQALQSPENDPQTAISPEWTRAIAELLQRHLAKRPDCHDAAAIVIDNASGRIRAMVGSPDIRTGSGQVNGTLMRRSAGSALKPFIYLEAIAAGKIVEDTILTDAPVRFGNYAPGNFDGLYRGPVPARRALAESLNTPAVRLLAELGEKRILERFRQLHLLSAQDSRVNGLALALGSAGHTLTDIANAYSCIARGGMFLPWSMTGPVPKAERLYPESACRMVLAMLSERPLPECSFRAAWKTGTSSNFCDAWCFAVTPDYSVGVWFGNKDGAAVPGMTGFNTAAPAAGEILELLYQGKSPPEWKTETGIVTKELCRESGLRPGAACRERVPGSVCTDIPLALCEKCRSRKFPEPARILAPGPGIYRGTDFILRGSRPGTWFADGRCIGEGAVLKYTFAPGPHRIVLFAPDHSAEVRFNVLPVTGAE